MYHFGCSTTTKVVSLKPPVVDVLLQSKSLSVRKMEV